MTSPDVRDFVDGYLAEDDALLAARARAVELGCSPISPAGGATLSFLATTIAARAVVEVGTGAGVSGLWLLRGMAPDGVLTSIDVDPEKLRAARTAFTQAGYSPSRLRLINGLGLEVLPRLTDGGYDLVFIDAGVVDYPRYLHEAVRLLRPGGVVAFDDVLRDARIADDQDPDPTIAALREVTRQAREYEELVPILLPLGDGLLAAVRRG